ncbi:MAG: hypothetical protein SFV20_13520 [Sphingopyxis sp.]|nr:hypothetical protein [Sphingopyxis sp.]
MKSVAGIAILVLTCACSSTSDFQPQEAEIAKLEIALSRNSCVGDLDKWERAYVRKQSLDDLEPDKYDRRMIEFTLQRADGKTIKAGRKSLQRYEDWEIAGGCPEPNCLFGGYVIPTNELILDCGATP